MGPSIKYVTLVLANFDPSSLSNFVTHPGTSPKVRHTSRISPIFSRPSTKTLTTAPCTNSLSIVGGGFVRAFCLLSGRFCPFPLLSECMCYNRNIKHHLKFHVSYV